jgi:mercuric ion transport protein
VRECSLIKVGMIGAAVTLLCCVTPVLVLLLAAVGLSAAVIWFDLVLLSVLAVFVGLAVLGVLRWRRRRAA